MHGRSRGCTQFALDIRRKPGLDTSSMQEQLEAYIQALSDLGGLSADETCSVAFRDYEFLPSE